MNVALHSLGCGVAVTLLERFKDLGVLSYRQAHVVRPMSRRLPQPMCVGASHLGHLLKEAIPTMAQDGLVEVPVRFEIAAILPQPGLVIGVAEILGGTFVPLMGLAKFCYKFMVSGCRPGGRRNLNHEASIEELFHLLNIERRGHTVTLQCGAVHQAGVLQLYQRFANGCGRDFQLPRQGVDPERSTRLEFTCQQHLQEDVIHPIPECPPR